MLARIMWTDGRTVLLFLSVPKLLGPFSGTRVCSPVDDNRRVTGKRYAPVEGEGR